MTENRSQNVTYNATRGTSPHNENPRVDGNFTGTTDEILQWAACKWGIDEDWLRAQIVTESWWDQRTVGDTAAGDGCTSHGVGQVRRCYHDPAFEDENAVNSTAYNVDYTYSVWRSCYNGELTWLNTVERGRDYSAGDLLGCMGVWFSGRWYTQPALDYMNVVQGHFTDRTWTQSFFGPANPTTPPPTTTVAPTTTTTTQPTTTVAPTTTVHQGITAVWSNVTAGANREPEVVVTPAPDSAGVCFYRNGVFNRCDTTPNPYQMYPPVTLVNGDVLRATWGTGHEATHVVGGGPAPTTTTPPTTTQPPDPDPDPTTALFTETFDANSGLDRLTWGVYHRSVAHIEMGTPEPVNGADNNAGIYGTWSADHDLACGDAHSQRFISVNTEQDTTGANGWRPLVDSNVEQLMYVCRDHVMSSMGDVSGFSILWFAPKAVFSDVNSVSFDVNLTNLGDRKWWKVGVVSDALYNSTYMASPWMNSGGVETPGHVVSDVGSCDCSLVLEGPDRLFATWSGAASTAGRQGMAVGSNKVPCGADSGTDKMTRFPVSFTDNDNGTVTFNVNGSSCTIAGSFPQCPCRVVFLDQNYNPDKDGPVVGHTWHWDNIVVR
jgi:hypothetical protein